MSVVGSYSLCSIYDLIDYCNLRAWLYCPHLSTSCILAWLFLVSIKFHNFIIYIKKRVCVCVCVILLSANISNHQIELFIFMSKVTFILAILSCWTCHGYLHRTLFHKLMSLFFSYEVAHDPIVSLFFN